MLTRRFLHVLPMAFQIAVAIGAIGVASARAQGLGGAGTVQGTVKDPTGGVMQAVEVKISNPVSGFTRTTTTDAAGKFVFGNLPPNPLSRRRRGAGLQDARARRRRAERRADRRRPGAGAGRRDHERRGRRPRRGSARAGSDRAHRHRSEPDREAAARVVVRPEPGDHARVARRRRRIPTASSTRSAITPRRSSRSTTSRSPISRAGSIRIRSRRTRCSRWRSSPASRRPSTATRAASSCTSSPSRASISRSRPAARRSATARSRVPTGEFERRRRLAHASATSCRSAGMRTDRFLDPPEFAALHDHGQQPLVLQSPRRARRRHRARFI